MKKTYYIGLIKASNKVIISTSSEDIAQHIGVSRMTVSRQLRSVNVYENDVYIIWRNISIEQSHRGFANRLNRKYIGRKSVKR